jgi:hypothetical protein
MQVAVWDTYVTRKNGIVMHFDIIAPTEIKDENIIYEFGRQYLATKNESGQTLASKECAFCHIEQASEEMENAIADKGFYILEMKGCQ